MSNNFIFWNGTSIAHMFIGLMTKTNLEDFNNDYNILKDFIKWHKNNEQTYLFYNFTQENMNELLNLITYDTHNNNEHIHKLWTNIYRL